MAQNRPKEYPFDHLVIIGRDDLPNLSQQFQSQGFQLTPVAHHNLGSCNQLIMLNTAYIELLGWEAGKPPQRAEIANQAIGLDALVFRTDDAQATYEQLQAAGFAVNPVQDLSREAEFLGKTVVARFKTVRFAQQPLQGIRIYFCEHLTPEFVWQEQWLIHQNQIDYLEQITLACADTQNTANTLSKLLNLTAQDEIHSKETISLRLPNLTLSLHQDGNIEGTKIESARLIQSSSDAIDFVINSDFLTAPTKANDL